MPPEKHWLEAKAKGKARTAQVIIDGSIGKNIWDDDSVASNEFINSVRALGDVDEIELLINSQGGSVDDGLAIANFLRGHPAKVTAKVIGQASSIASIVASAADETVMGIGSWGLIHNPWTVGMGNASDLREIADMLDKIGKSLMDSYVAKCGEEKRGQLEEIIKANNGQGTTLMAREWVEIGLADRLDVDLQAAANACKHDLSKFLETARQQRKQPPPKEPPQNPQENAMTLDELKAKHPELVKALSDEIKAQNPTGTLEVSALTLDTLKAQHPELVASIQKEGPDAQAAVTAERERAADIMKACATYNQPQMAEKLIINGTDKQMAADLLSVFASNAGDQSNINTNHGGDNDPNNASDANRILANYRAFTGNKSQTA